MVGPDKNRLGGIAAVARSYLESWDYERYDLLYIASTAETKRLGKLLRFLWSIVEFCYRSLVWRPEIVHIHFTWKASFWRMVLFVTLARSFRFTTVLHCHSGRFDLYYESHSKAGKWVIRRILKMGDQLLVVSKTWQDYFQSLSLSTPICVLNNSVTCPQDVPSYEMRQPIVLSLGRLEQPKGTYDILQAVPRVLESCAGAEFWLAGEGEIAQVQRRLNVEPWGSHVRVLGWVQGEEKQQALRQGMIFLLPSYYEGLPMALLEAMAYGMPVVSCPVGGIGEVVIDSKNGFLVQPGDVDGIVEKLQMLLNDAKLAQELGEAGRKLVCADYNIDSLLQRLYRIYDHVLVGTAQVTKH